MGENKKMKKLPVSIILSLLLLQALMITNADPIQKESYLESIVFSKLDIKDVSSNQILLLQDTEQYAQECGEFLRPTLIKTFTFPFGTQIEDIQVLFSDSYEVQLIKPLVKKPIPIHSFSSGWVTNNDLVDIEPEIIRASYSYTIDVGIKNHQRVVYINVYITPVSYDPKTNCAVLYEKAELKMDIKSRNQVASFPDEYDFVIIAPDEFTSATVPLVEHKQERGIRTFLKTTEEIYREYDGVDAAEKIKFFIKDAIEEFGIDYVLLIGGRNGGVFEEKWNVPVRYAHVDDQSNFETSYISDLYFADIYNETSEFATWDSNGNGIFAEWKGQTKDIIGLYPDVYLGRLPCRNSYEVTLMVNKIINYETIDKSSWFYNMVVVGGDSAPGYPYYEGEEENKQALEYMDGFHGIHCWTSDQTLTGPNDVIDAVNPGCGFLFFDGHGNPSSWSNHPPDDAETWITGLTISDMPSLHNIDKYPVCVIGGCHNGQFNVSLLNLIKDFIQYGPSQYLFGPPYKFYHMEWVPECWAWRLACTNNGGSIATLAYTGLDWFAEGDYDQDGIPDCTQYFSGFTNTHFFKNYGQNNIHILGETHTQTLIDYLEAFPPMNEVHDCKTVEEFTLLGDPTLNMEV